MQTLFGEVTCRIVKLQHQSPSAAQSEMTASMDEFRRLMEAERRKSGGAGGENDDSGNKRVCITPSTLVPYFGELLGWSEK